VFGKQMICAVGGAQRKDWAMDRDDVIGTLNDLIETSKDG